MSEEIMFLIGVILMNILFWVFIYIFDIKQSKLENKMLNDLLNILNKGDNKE